MRAERQVPCGSEAIPSREIEVDRRRIGIKAEAFFEDLWRRGDPWDLDTSEFEQGRLARLLALLDGRRFSCALEIGCGAGRFTRLLAPIAARVVALDISPTAIARARESMGTISGVDLRVANIMDYDLSAEGPWDLVVMSETISYLGWLYPFFDVAWLAAELFAATQDGGRLLLA